MLSQGNFKEHIYRLVKHVKLENLIKEGTI